MIGNVTSSEFGNKVSAFVSPTQLPAGEAERLQWQAANRAWWQATPMRYDWREGIAFEPGSRDYFAEIDRRFFAAIRPCMPWRQRPFEPVIPFEGLRDKDVLEIGVGQGSHAALIAPYCKSFAGIDLTEIAVEMTDKRLRLAGLAADLQRMDAEEMSFTDSSFDYVWSWGVLHHSADTRRALNEVHRILRPGGRCTVMVYHRSWWTYYVVCGLLKGVLLGGLLRHGSLHRIGQVVTDGALARYYRPREWRRMAGDLFEIESVRIFGLKTDIIPLPHSAMKTSLERAIPDRVARFLVHRLRMGSFLVVDMRRA